MLQESLNAAADFAAFTSDSASIVSQSILTQTPPEPEIVELSTFPNAWARAEKFSNSIKSEPCVPMRKS